MNELDRAIMAAIRSRAKMPGLFRLLIEGELWFLVPFQPENEGEDMELKPGSPLPFVQLKDGDGAIVPVFSTCERVEEGLKQGKVPENSFSAAAMPAANLFSILGHAGLRAVINKGCATGSLTFPPDLMRDLADGTALRPAPLGGTPAVEGTLQIIDPADRPTDLVQRMFELLRQHRQFRAAWIFGVPGGEKLPTGGRRYQVLVLMEPRDEVVFHDLQLVTLTMPRKFDEVDLGLLDENDAPLLARLFQTAPPFFTAADFGESKGSGA